MGDSIWNNAVEYLINSRMSWWNNDYMEFLIEKVWKIKKPVSVVDFGCGIGFLGELLLPLLPKGSVYTGIDVGDKLLDEARKKFKDKEYETHLIEADLNDYEPKEKYDIAICQTVLQHIPNSINILKKMKKSVKPEGMVICIELSRDVSGAAIYIDGLDYGKLNTLGIEQKLRRNSLDRVGKDFEIGLKLPVYMERIGLENVGIRVNDHAQFISASQIEYKNKVYASMSGEYPNKMSRENKEEFVKNLVDRGLTEKEAEHEFESRLEISNHLYKNQEKSSIVVSNGMFISYGYNPKNL